MSAENKAANAALGCVVIIAIIMLLFVGVGCGTTKSSEKYIRVHDDWGQEYLIIIHNQGPIELRRER